MWVDEGVFIVVVFGWVFDCVIVDVVVEEFEVGVDGFEVVVIGCIIFDEGFCVFLWLDLY